MELTIALAQMRIAPLDPEKNLERMRKFIIDAKNRKADLVVFPEDAICGPLRGQTSFVEQAPRYLERMQELAVEHAVDLVPGTWTVADQGLLYNQACYIDAQGNVLGAYRKVNLWETERVQLTPGTTVSVFPTRFGLVGLIVCWDISFPALFGAMNALGVELVIAPAFWSFTRPPGKAWRVIDKEVQLIDALCIARSFENNILFAYCNAAGRLNMPGVRSMLSGRSQVTHPHDKAVALCSGNEEELLVAHAQLHRSLQ